MGDGSGRGGFESGAGRGKGIARPEDFAAGVGGLEDNNENEVEVEGGGGGTREEDDAEGDGNGDGIDVGIGGGFKLSDAL